MELSERRGVEREERREGKREMAEFLLSSDYREREYIII